MKKTKKVLLFSQLWNQDNGLSVMFVLLMIMHFVIIPLFGSYYSFMIIINVLRMLFLLAGIFTLSNSRKQAFLISIIPLVFIICFWLRMFNSNPLLLLVEFILSVATFLLLILLVLKKVFEPGPITIHRIIGSIVIYMAMAHIWMIVYVYFYENVVGSFQLNLPPFEGNSSEANFLYFSYVTISTTGFGEILPLHPLLRALVNMESVFGVLYPIVLIGRLVADVNKFSAKNA